MGTVDGDELLHRGITGLRGCMEHPHRGSKTGTPCAQRAPRLEGGSTQSTAIPTYPSYRIPYQILN